MADNIGNKASKDYHLDIPASTEGFFLKGLNNNDFGLKNRLSHIFNQEMQLYWHLIMDISWDLPQDWKDWT